MRAFTAPLAALALLLAATAPAATAPSADDRRDPVVSPTLIRASSQHDPAPGAAATLYPAQARKAALEGFVDLRCIGRPEGRFADCTVLDEDPKGAGFGEAAVAAAAHVQLPPTAGDLKALENRPTILPFLFDIEEREQLLFKPNRADWEQKPQGVDIARVYPQDAVQADREGNTVISCEIAADGRLVNCRSLGESPYGWGFKGAALALAPIFKLKTTLSDGRPLPVGATIRIPIGFRLPKG